MQHDGLRKRCLRCGWVGWARPRQQRCRARRFGRGSYACWGQLQTVVRPTSPADVPTPAGLGVGWQLGKEAAMLRAVAKRAEAARKRDAAQKKVDEWTRTVADASRRLRQWQTRANRYAREANLTDAEIAAQSERGRQANQAKSRPKIKRAIRVPMGSTEAVRVIESIMDGALAAAAGAGKGKR